MNLKNTIDKLKAAMNNMTKDDMSNGCCYTTIRSGNKVMCMKNCETQNGPSAVKVGDYSCESVGLPTCN